MNSRQRRIDRKRWQHCIVTDRISYSDYQAMWEWLKSRHGANANRCGWRDRVKEVDSDVMSSWNELYTVNWEFTDERNAVEFALRWVK